MGKDEKNMRSMCDKFLIYFYSDFQYIGRIFESQASDEKSGQSKLSTC